MRISALSASLLLLWQFVPAGATEPEKPETASFTSADYARHIAELKKKIHGEGFTIVVERPFVVLGDEPALTVKRRAADTVKWAVDMLRQDYFKKEPDEILDIWLFKDEASYRQHAKEIFGEEPSTPFGYYSHENRSLVMNINTGGGTLVHEIVHPFMRSNFPACPAWFNEGLASLYEQSAEKDGRITGLTNWRLAALKEAVRGGKLPSFETLTATSDHQFYCEDKGTNYAQARYLCYYLQEKGLLVKFYREFRAGSRDDPTGLATLKRVLGETDMDAFKESWEAFVMKLEYP